MRYDGQEKRVRPDIIIHNRKSGDRKRNFLIVECKKDSASNDKKDEDVKKIEAFLTDERYKYQFGLQTVYSNQSITGKLFYLENQQIKSRDIVE